MGLQRSPLPPCLPLVHQQRKVTKEIIAQRAAEVLEERPSDDSEAAPEEAGTVDAKRGARGTKKKKKRVKQKRCAKLIQSFTHWPPPPPAEFRGAV